MFRIKFEKYTLYSLVNGVSVVIIYVIIFISYNINISIEYLLYNFCYYIENIELII